MRDAYRMKEKIDLSLDNKQIVSLLIASLVVLGAVFVLGVVVGKKLAVDQRAVGAPDLLTALDAKASQPPADPPDLTFQEELTRKGAEPPVRVLDLPPAPAAPAAPVAAAPAPAQMPVPDGKVEPTPTAARTATPEPARISPAPAAPPKAAGAFALQVGASQNRVEADRLAAKLRGKGYAPTVVEASVPGRGLWYRVRMGGFATKEAAQRYLQDFRRETRMDAFVTAN